MRINRLKVFAGLAAFVAVVKILFWLIDLLPVRYAVQALAIWTLKGIAILVAMHVFAYIQDRMRRPFYIEVWNIMAIYGAVLTLLSIILTGGVMMILQSWIGVFYYEGVDFIGGLMITAITCGLTLYAGDRAHW